jgi:hypothetical protein
MNLPKDVKSLRQKFEDLYKQKLSIEKDASQRAIPYYADLNANKYSVLTDRDQGEVKDPDPYNKTVAAFIDRSELGEVFRFQDGGVKKESIPLLDDLAVYIHQLRKPVMDWRVENGSTAKSQLFKLVNNYVADIYWESVTGISEPLVPKSVLDKFNQKNRQIKKSEIYSHRNLLVAHLKEFNSGEHKDRMANAYSHMIKVAVKEGMSSSEEYYVDNFISQHKRFTPNIQMFHVKGIIPDVKIGRYKSLFILPEWECIVDSTLESAEKSLGELMKKQLTPYNTLSVLRQIQKIRKDVELDALSIEVKKVRRERLLIASQLKSQHKTRTSFKLSAAVFMSHGDNRVAEAFNPFRIPFAADEIETSPGEASTVFGQDEDGVYRYRATPENDKLDNGKVKRIALVYTAWLNS